MDVTVRKNEQEGRYEGITADGDVAGYADYHLSGDRVVFPHTVTHPQYREQGVAAQVVRAALDDARDRGLKVVPSCWYVAGFIRDNPEYADLVR
ncbi:GNAT family N-acetyltransferase [Blastococcus sp. Marseille-P5729]|uniref:GNAT family N-acetyltransferase n=1 Tax=Blastococcus sp. Marseille-P5729 TaxID=2086582 RepID=UPI000D114816|nr:GNAT family N-acetyltransferase [Blastococcus sp. Marseille-P5729]